MIDAIATHAAKFGILLLVIGIPIILLGVTERFGGPEPKRMDRYNGVSVTGAVLIVIGVLLLLYAAQIPYVPNE